jgi:indole-3-glycerol phosphate synthase
MDNFLERMASSSRDRVAAARARESLADLTARALVSPVPLALALSGFDLIAELKLRSPAQGGLADPDFDPSGQLQAYAAGGAAVVSVLTEPAEFNGTLAQLNAAATLLRPSSCPVMRKDFLVDAYQVVEARANGASGVLLIAAMLSDADLDEMTAAAAGLGLFVLLEAFDSDDLARIARLNLRSAQSQTLVGVNSRNLKTLAVDFGRFERLAGEMPDDVPAVAESGIETAADIETIARLGFSMALVGSALMRDADVQRTVAAFVTAGRGAIRERATCS